MVRTQQKKRIYLSSPHMRIGNGDFWKLRSRGSKTSRSLEEERGRAISHQQTACRFSGRRGSEHANAIQKFW